MKGFFLQSFSRGHWKKSDRVPPTSFSLDRFVLPIARTSQLPRDSLKGNSHKKFLFLDPTESWILHREDEILSIGTVIVIIDTAENRSSICKIAISNSSC